MSARIEKLLETLLAMRRKYCEEEIFEDVKFDFTSPSSLLNAIEAADNLNASERISNLIMLHMLDKLSDSLGDILDDVNGTYSIMDKNEINKAEFKEIVETISDCHRECQKIINELNDSLHPVNAFRPGKG